VAIPKTKLLKYTTTVRSYIFDLANAPEIVSGETISSPTVTGSPSGLTIGTPTILEAETLAVPSGKGVAVTISGGTAGTSYTLTCTVTTSGGATLVVKGDLEVE